MLIVISTALLPLILIFLLYKRRNDPKTLNPPGPRGLPFIGNLHRFGAASDKHIFLWKISQEYGPIVQMRLGSCPLLVVSTAKLAKEVLKTLDLAFCSRPKLLGQQKLSYNASDIAFSPYGHYWRELRKITAVHLFSAKKTQSFRPIREEEVSHVISKIKKKVNHPSSPPPSSSNDVLTVNLSEMAMALTSTLICRVAFGKRYDDQGSEIRRFEKLSTDAQGVMASFYVSDYFPWFGWVDKLNGSMDRLDKAFGNLDSFYQELIDEHLDPRREKKAGEEEDLLDVLINLKETKCSAVELGWDEIKGLLMNIFIGATDTIAASIVWTMTALMKAPQVMRKVQAEIRNLVGEKGEVDEDDVPKLPFLKAVIKEAMRLYPAAPLLIPRETIETCTLEGYTIHPKTLVFVNAWAVARDPEYWENPDEFRPERFLNSNVDVIGQDFGALPFGSGRRICPGVSMGLATMELTFANLLYNFDWEMPPGMQAKNIDIEVLPGLTMHKKNPLILVAKDYIV